MSSAKWHLSCLGLIELVQSDMSSGTGAVPCDLATPDSNVHGANMGPIWGRQDPGGPHVGPMNFAIWDVKPSLVSEQGGS